MTWLAGWVAFGRRMAAHSRMSLPGLFVAVLFLCLSLTPSLLPRTWQVQGVISGFSASIGYANGVGLDWLWQRTTRGRVFVRPRLRTSVSPRLRVYVSPQLRTYMSPRLRVYVSPRLRAMVTPAMTATGTVLLGLSLFQGSRWQRDLYLLMGERPPGRPAYLGVLVVTALVLVTMIGLARGLRFVARQLIRFLRRWVPAAVARIVGVTLVTLLTIALLDGLVHNGFLTVASATSATVNDSIGTSAEPPTSPTRSGSPQSLVTWDSLGMQGRTFVSGGPTLEQLRTFGGPQAREPIRVYVGLKSAPGITAASALAVRELERTGAFDRSILCVVTTTGTGWVDPYLAAALEYLHNGNTAIVGTQYSYLPSWISFLSDRQQVAQAGRELFDQVYARWSALPPKHRPRLLVFGESLGSLGSEATFRNLDDVRARTQGALWAGPTNANPLWNQLLAERDPGSPEVLPVIGGGHTVRFVSQPADLQRPGGEWSQPRVVYLQNPSDPVTWWSPRLLYARPDWLVEPRGYDVLPAMRWYPFVTFLQVTADLALAEGAPIGHGHSFRRAAVAAWAAIAPPAGWTPARTEQLTQLLEKL